VDVCVSWDVNDSQHVKDYWSLWNSLPQLGSVLMEEIMLPVFDVVI
jgi:hypothetical protein